METSAKKYFQNNKLSSGQVWASSPQKKCMPMEKKLSYTEREALRAKKGRQRTKEEIRKLRAQNKFLWKRYRAIAEEFEQEYAGTNGEMGRNPCPPLQFPPTFSQCRPQKPFRE
jgi:hypothetical protein